MTSLQNTLEAICDWTWNAFTRVDDRDETTWIATRLELASIAADNGDRATAMQWAEGAVERVFGCYSDEYKSFLSFAGDAI